MLHELERFDEGLFYCLFDTPDRVQHMFWRFREPDHPANRGEPPRPSWPRVDRGPVPPRRRGRRQGARVRRRRDAGDRPQRPRLRQLPARRPPEHAGSTTTASWPCEPGVEPGEEAGDLLRGVDWSRTRAYALGPGRDLPQPRRAARGRGSSRPTRPRRSRPTIARGLDGLVDPERRRGRRSAGVRPREAVYSRPVRRRGARPARPLRRGLPRLLGHRRWGACPRGIFEDNTQEVERRPHHRPRAGPRRPVHEPAVPRRRGRG